MQADAHVTAATIDSPKLNISADGRCDLPETAHCIASSHFCRWRQV